MNVVLKHLSGQSLVSVVNVLVGIFFIWWLPIEDFALYVLVLFLQTTTCAFSDFGISSGVNTFVSGNVKNHKFHAAALHAAWKLWRRFIPIAILSVSLLAIFVLMPLVQGWRAVFLTLFAVVCGILQTRVNVHKSVLNARSDAKSLLGVGIAECVPRLILSPLCFFLPHVEIALMVNLIGIFSALFLIDRLNLNVKRDFQKGLMGSVGLDQFVSPLMPSVVYSVFQGHIGILILSSYGFSKMVAETGALGRISQVLGILLLLNPFWVQPCFAKIIDRSKFCYETLKIILILVSAGIFIFLSAYSMPNVWLWFLGKNYQASGAELPIAVGSMILYSCSAVLYTISISRNATKGQSWCVILGVSFQIVFLWAYGITTVSDALFVGMLPATGSLIVQVVIISNLILRWNYKEQ
jgi:O-antigen/teichoic acid export membrane protein